MMGAPLEGVKALEVAAYLAGPYLGAQLAALGAEVIKVEPPGQGDKARIHEPLAGSRGVHMGAALTDDDMAVSILKRAHNKKSITLNLKTEQGRALFLDLAKTADVIFENFQVGTVKRLGIDYEAVKAVNPGIIYCSVTGFGQTGPYANMLAYDPIIQAMSGMMATNGHPGSPPLRSSLAAADEAPPLFGALAVVSALYNRSVNGGPGQYIDISMLDCITSMLFEEHFDCLAAEGLDLQFGNRLPRTEPMDCYPTKDGHVVILIAVRDQWRRLAEALGAPQLADDPKFGTAQSRRENREEIDRLIRSWMAARTTEEAVAELVEHEVPAGPVRTIPQVLNDPHLKHRGVLAPMPHPKLDKPVDAVVPTFPVKFSSLPLPALRPAPVLGGNNAEIYGGWLGLSQADLERLQLDGVI